MPFDNRTPQEKQIESLLRVHRRNFGTEVVYSRGATDLTISSAIQGSTKKANIDVGDEEQVVETIEWLIGVEDLSPVGPPQFGDTITRIIEGTSYVFKVTALYMGESPWDWSDRARSQYRINTRKDGANAFEVSEPTGFDLEGNELTYE